MSHSTLHPETGSSAPETKSFGAIREYWWPWVLGMIVGIVLLIWNPPTDRTAIALAATLDGAIGAASILAGFQVTALTLLLSLADRPIVKAFRDLGHYDRLIVYHRQAILSLLLWLVLSLIMIAVQGATLDEGGGVRDQGWVTRWAAVLIAAIASAALGACLRVTTITIKLLRIAANQPTAPP